MPHMPASSDPPPWPPEPLPAAPQAAARSAPASRAPSRPSPPSPAAATPPPAPKPRSLSPRRRTLAPEALLLAADESNASLVSWADLLPQPSGASLPPPPAASQPPSGWAEEDADPFEPAGQEAPSGGRRRVEYVPYTQSDYSALLGSRAYWQLGTLGPDLHTDELAAKRAARQRALEFARQAHGANVVDLAGRPKPEPKAKPESARLRMRSFAATTFAPGGGLLAEVEEGRSSRSASPDGRAMPVWKPGSGGGTPRRRAGSVAGPSG
jgi:hypothetical protein